MEKGNADQFKNLSLEEIDIDMENVLEETNKNPLQNTSKNTTHEEHKIKKNINTDIIPDAHKNSIALSSSSDLNNISHDYKSKSKQQKKTITLF